MPLITKASIPIPVDDERRFALAFGNKLDFLHSFAYSHLQHVYENPDETGLDNDLSPHLLHTAIQLSFAQKQRDRAIREKNEAIRDRDAAVQEKEALLGVIRAAIGKYS